MQSKLSTLMEDKKILNLLLRGEYPKAIKVELKLSNTMRIYNAVRRFKQEEKNRLQNIAKIYPCTLNNSSVILNTNDRQLRFGSFGEDKKLQ